MSQKKKTNGKKINGKLRKELADQVFKFFGRTKDKYLSLTHTLLQENMGLDAGKIEWVIGLLIDEGKVASLTDLNNNVIYVIRKKDRWKYTPEELINILNEKYFNDVGLFLYQEMSKGPVSLDQDFFESHEDNLSLPAELLKQVTNCFLEAGLLTIDANNKLKFTALGRKSKLNYGILKSVFLSTRFLSFSLETIGQKRFPITTLNDVARAYHAHEKANAITKPSFDFSDKSFVTLQHLTEILYGHQDLDLEFLNKVIAELQRLTQEQRPDVIIVSGLIQGGFQHKQKNRRATLAIKSEGDQLKAAKLFLEELTKLGIHVIYNRGNDDNEICENRTVDAMQIMGRLKTPETDNKKRSVNYFQLDKLKQNKAWDFHKWFQWAVVFEYMLRCGRRLRSADEVAKLYGRRVEEYLLLLDTYIAIINGKPVDSLCEQVLEIDNIPIPNKTPKDFIVTDDFNLKLQTKSKTIRVWEKHNLALTPTSMIQDPTKVAREILGQLATSGQELPDILITEHQQQCFGVLCGPTLVASTAGMHTANLQRSSLASDVQIDPSRRKLTTRRDLFNAGSQRITYTDDGRILITFLNKQFLNKMGTDKDPRTAVVVFSDWQTGSVTARSDLQVIALNHVMHHILPHYPTHMFWAGDLIQGRNYPAMPNENVRMGLIQISDQKSFLREFVRSTLLSTNPEYFKNLVHLGLMPGNHEWNSGGHGGHALTGDDYTDFLRNTFTDFIEYKLGMQIPVKHYEKVATQFGEHFNAWVALENVCGYGILIQHMIMAKGGKGASGPPVYQARGLFSGTGTLLQNVDIMFSGHWHHPNYLIANNKLVVVNGSLAGISGYEYERGYYPVIGTVVMYLGGGEPPVLEIITADALYKVMLEGFFSKENLANMGFFDDHGFNPVSHGFARINNQPQSAIQKYLWNIIDRNNWKFLTTM